jgi:hypothetical protein
MRLSDWRTRAPHKDAMTPKVVAVIEPVLAALGAEADASCWIVWGDDPAARYVVLAPTDAGLLQVLVRVNIPQEGPRASAKVIRWSRVQLGELGLEMADGHRLLGFQVEGHVLRGTDDVGDEMAAFALELFARVDGRAFVPRPAARSRAGKPAAAGGGATKPAVRKTAAASGSASKPTKQAAGPSSSRG